MISVNTIAPEQPCTVHEGASVKKKEILHNVISCKKNTAND